MEKTLKQTKAIHKFIDYERRNVEEAKLKLDYLNKVIWKLQNTYSEEFLKKCYTWGAGIDFKDLKEDEYHVCKGILKDFAISTGDYEKESSEYNLTLRASLKIGEVTRYDYEYQGDVEDRASQVNVFMDVHFKWGVPDTCEIIETRNDRELRSSDYYEKDGKLYQKVIAKEIKCTKPVLQSVFSRQQESTEA
tara:strand:+ start:183 stop:758 length:576 start_codon:yes stop_codon:yes gene_type:complete